MLFCTVNHVATKARSTQQPPQDEVERFVKEKKALKTTAIVVGAVLLNFLPVALTIFSTAVGVTV